MSKYYTSTLQKGSQGDEVKEWQKFLNSQGYNLTVDGDFGDNTNNATIEWQTKNGLYGDGIVGEKSWGLAGYTPYSTISTPTAAPSINTSATALPTFNPLPINPTYDTTKWNDTEQGQNALEGYNSAKDAVNNYGDFDYADYVMGESAQAAQNALNAHLTNKPGEYQSQWQSQLDELMSSIMNRDKFSYDLNGDALYQQYKDKYIQQGKLAMGDAIGQASAMTGGYGNSYAQSVGQQQYQAQLNNLNDIVPELYQMALDRYNQEGQDLYNKYGIVADRENLDYSRYRDTVSDYLTERDYLQGRFDSERNFDYGKYIDDRNLDYTLYQDEYNRLLDSLGIAQSDYYDGANMFYTEQSNKNSVLGQQFTDAMNRWNADTSQKWNKWEAAESARKEANEEAWKQVEWEESLRQDAVDEYWKQKEWDANQDYIDWQKSQASSGSGSGNGSGDNENSGGSNYDNGDLTAAQVEALQKALGVSVDGKYGSETKKAAHGMSANEAYNTYVKNSGSGPLVSSGSPKATQFINSYSDKSRYLAAGHSESEYYAYIEDNIAAALRSGTLSDPDALYLIEYYGIK
jgi:peptidoglycan hydrolase-like protein with peptidoglycan-binding domain